MEILSNLALGLDTAVSLHNLMYCFVGVFLGTSTAGIGDVLAEAGVISDATVWDWYTKMRDVGTIKAGRYEMQLDSSFDEAIEGCDGDVVLDLGGVTFLSTLGIGLIVSTQDRLDDDDRALRLANVPEFIDRTFRTMNLDEIFERA